MKKYLSLLMATLFMVGCGPDKQEGNVPALSLKIAETGKTQISDEIRSIEYVPLELTDESLIAELLELCVTDEYLFILSTRQDGILQFDRKGHFIRKVANTGNGPGETGDIISISVDEANQVLCVSEYFYLSYFSFDGEFIQRKNISRPYAAQYCIGPNTMGEMGRQFVPLNTPGMYTLGVFNTATDDTIGIKYQIEDPALIPAGEAALKTWHWNYATNGLLCHTEGNDTVWNLTANGVEPAFIIATGYPDNIRREMLAIQAGQEVFDNEYNVFSLFETPRRYYVKTFMNNRFYLYSLDKTSGQVTRETSRQDSEALFKLNRQLTGIGMQNETDGGLPIWPYYSYPARKELVQFNTAVEIGYLKEQMPALGSIPAIAAINDESNPLITIYHLK